MKVNSNIIKGVIFDLDGVLVDTEYFQWQGWVEALKPYGASLSKKEYLKYAGKRGDMIESELVQDLNLDIVQGTLLKKKEHLLMKWFLTEQLQLMPFAEEVLQHVAKKELLLACASGGPRDEVQLKLKQVGLLPFFKYVVTGSDVERGKPFPDIYLLAAQSLGLRPEQCLTFEDTQYGVASAKSAGLTCFAIPNEYSQEQDFSQADGVFTNLKEVISSLN